MAPPPQGPQTVPQLFTEMQKAIQKQDFKNVVKYANMILHTKEGNHDQDALKAGFSFIHFHNFN